MSLPTASTHALHAIAASTTVPGVLVIGGGIAGLVTALELLNAGKPVTIVERGGPDELGGLARWAFGGMALVDTPMQRLLGIRDSAELALSDWLSFAQFGADDVWPRRWAEHYVQRCQPEVYEWLRSLGLLFIPAVQWVERGLMRPGNSVPRYHVLWGTAEHLVRTVLAAIAQHPQRSKLTVLHGHRVQGLTMQAGRVAGCTGVMEGSSQPFELKAGQVVVATGGITGDLNQVRQHWPVRWGQPPAELLNGSHPASDGLMHAAVAHVGGRLTHLDQMWHYAAGVEHPQPAFEGHGLSLIPARSALWTDPSGQRIGPVPWVTGFDTEAMVAQFAQAGWPHTWQVMNRRIALRELAASGALHNPLIRDRKAVAFAWQMVAGASPVADELLAFGRDAVQADTLDALVGKMNGLILRGPGAGRAGPPSHAVPHVDLPTLRADLDAYDAMIMRGQRLHNDDQLRRIMQLRGWLGDRIRTCAPHPIQSPKAGPLIAIRCRLLTRKSMGGIQTNLHSQVLQADGEPLPGLYAVGEASGFGGGGSNGQGSLEGTFLSGCILTAKAAARSLVASS
jgi:uncharacterized protein